MLIQTDNFGYSNSYRCRLHEGIYDYPKHIHQFAEIAIVIDGEIEIMSTGHKLKAKSGDIVFIPPFEVHGFSTPKCCTIWITVFSLSMVSDIAQELSLKQPGVISASSPLLEYVKSMLIYPKEKTAQGTKAGLFALGEEILRKAPTGEGGRCGTILPKIFMYLEEHYKENISLSDVATGIGYSQSYISHALSSLPSLSFTSALSGIRVEHSKRLLSVTDMPIGTIALECGFGCERSFHRAFFKLVGKTPKEYRMSRKQGF